MPALVLDASVALEWCFPAENAEYAGKILCCLKDYVARVPGLWPIEVSNAILVVERRKGLSASEIARFFQLIAVLPVELDDRTPPRAFGETMMLA